MKNWVNYFFRKRESIERKVKEFHLSIYIAECLKSRRVLAESDYGRGLIIYCAQHEVDAAVEWCQELTGSLPEMLAIFRDKAVRSPVNVLKTRDIRRFPQYLCVVYGSGLRKKAIELARKSIRDVVFFKDPQFKNSKFKPSYFQENAPDLQRVFQILEDDFSRKTYASVVKQRVTGEHGYLLIAPYREYFHPFVMPAVGDWIIDAGASNGETTHQFSLAAGINGHVFAIEPDEINIKKIKNRDMIDNVTIVHSAISNISGSMKFAVTGTGSSKADENSESIVPCITVDSLKLKKCDLISLDIEGAETDALIGAMETIKKHRPKLQVSIYHRESDLFSIPLLLISTLENYAFFVGHHDAYHSETDFYAIPREKLG